MKPADKGSSSGEHIYLSFITVERELLNQAWDLGILDTACTSTVAGSEWLNAYVHKLDSESRQLVKKTHSVTKIVFGGNNSVAAIAEVEIPVQIGEIRCFLKVQAIPGTLPLLISVKSMIRAGICINLPQNCVTIAGSNDRIPLLRLSTAHIAVKLLPVAEDAPISSLVLIGKEVMNHKKVAKLHQQFSRCSKERLQELLCKAGYKSLDVKTVIEKVCSSCSVCARYGRAPVRPVASLPWSNHFSDVIAIDLHELTSLGRSIYYIHIIDLFTRFSQAEIIENKRGSTIVNSLNKLWIFSFGAPNKTLTDNGGEFCNHEFQTNAENLDISHLNSPAESPMV